MLTHRRQCLRIGSWAVLSAGAWMPLLAQAEAPPAELARIERLIRYVEAQTSVKFVRNGSDYSPADAAKFLRGKFKKMGEHVSTAQQFIDQIASKSSTSGQLYLIRHADGRTEPAGEFLGNELQRMDR